MNPQVRGTDRPVAWSGSGQGYPGLSCFFFFSFLSRRVRCRYYRALEEIGGEGRRQACRRNGFRCNWGNEGLEGSRAGVDRKVIGRIIERQREKSLAGESERVLLSGAGSRPALKAHEENVTRRKCVFFPPHSNSYGVALLLLPGTRCISRGFSSCSFFSPSGSIS